MYGQLVHDLTGFYRKTVFLRSHPLSLREIDRQLNAMDIDMQMESYVDGWIDEQIDSYVDGWRVL